jgi:hypothetical protein
MTTITVDLQLFCSLIVAAQKGGWEGGIATVEAARQRLEAAGFDLGALSVARLSYDHVSHGGGKTSDTIDPL